MADLATTINELGELGELGVGFVSLTEALDFTAPYGRAMGRPLAVFAELEMDLIREKVNAGITPARSQGDYGRPPKAQEKVEEILSMAADGLILLAIQEYFPLIPKME